MTHKDVSWHDTTLFHTGI